MTDREREILIDCLQRRWNELEADPGANSDDLDTIDSLMDRLRAKQLASKQAASSAPAATVETRTTRNFAIKEAQDQIEQIVEMCEQVAEYDSSSAQDFAASVQEKAESIGTWIDEHNDVTTKQQEALDNMESGISRWIR